MEVGQLVEEARQTVAGDRHIDELSRTLPTVVVDDVEDTQAAAGAQAVADEIQGSPLVPAFRRRQRHALAPWQTAALLGSDGQAFLLVEAAGALGVDDEVFSRQ